MRYYLRFTVLAAATILFAQNLPADESAPAESTAATTSAIPNVRDGQADVIDPARLVRAKNKLAAAVAIADRFSAEAAAEHVDSNWRITLITNMMRGSQESFDHVAASSSLAEARLTALEAAAVGTSNSSGSQAKALGSVGADLVFEPLSPPCRIVDTRKAGGAFATSETRNYTFANSTSQGGDASCHPYNSYSGTVYPAAMAVNVTAVSLGLGSPSASGFLSIFPQGGSAQAASFLNYYGNEIVANAGIVELNQSTGYFSVFTQNPTQVVVDYFGSFVESPASGLTCMKTTAVLGSMSTAGTNSRFVGGVTVPACPAGFTATSINCRTSSLSDSISIASDGMCYGNSETNGDTISASQTCCQVPGR